MKLFKKNKGLNRICVWLLLLVMMSGALTMTGSAEVVESKGGSLTVSLKMPEGSVDPEIITGVSFALYKVADLADANAMLFKLDPALADTGVDINGLTTADLARAAADKLGLAVVNTTITPDVKATDSDGKIYYTGLADGAYVLIQNGDNDYGTFSPSLLTLPYYTKDGKLSYDLTIEPKGTPAQVYGSMSVEKLITDIYGNYLFAEDADFYMGLFRDAACTVPYVPEDSSDGKFYKNLHIHKGSSNTVKFENLPLGTYYLREVDENGVLVPLNEAVYTDDAVFVVTITNENGEENNHIQVKPMANVNDHELKVDNAYLEWPEDFYLEAKITINKVLLKNGSKTTMPNMTFYAGVFKKENDKLVPLLDAPVELVQNGSVIVEVPLGGEKGDESVTYFVYETDENYNIIDPKKVQYDITVSDDNKVHVEVVDREAQDIRGGEITITNKFVDVTITPTPGVTIPPNTPPNTNVKTGDDTPIGIWIFAIVAAFAVVAVVVVKKKKSR